MSISETEPFVQALCRRTFLRRWTYENPSIDRGRNEINSKGKELCDALILFGNKIIIISDKNCQFNDSGDLGLSWSRWERSAIKKSQEQLVGAERWIRKFPGKIFVDEYCTQQIRLPSTNVEIYRIVVAHGLRPQIECEEFQRCRVQFSVLSRRLAQNIEKTPFHIIKIRDDGSIFHIFDEFSITFALEELDTVRDFVSYLEKKERLFAVENVTYRGEENLIALYLRDVNAEGEHDFVLDKSGVDENKELITYVRDDEFDFVTHNQAFWRKKRADEVSYLIDGIIEYFEELARQNRLVGEISDADLETILRIIASTDRLERRMLAESLRFARANTNINQRRMRLARLSDPKVVIIFSILGLSEIATEEFYRMSQYELSACHQYNAFKENSDVNKVIVLGFEALSTPRFGIITFSVAERVDPFERDPELEEYIERRNIGKNSVYTEVSAQEYPDEQMP